MAIDPQNTDAVAIPQLDPLVLALSTFLVGANADGKMGNYTAQELAEFISPYVSSLGSSPFVTNTGSPLPNPVDKPTAITFVGIGTFTQTTGSDIITTEELNVLFWNGVTWSIGIEVPIDLTGYAKKLDVDVSLGILSNINAGGTTTTTNLLNTYNFASSNVFVPSGKTVRTITFPYNTVTPSYVLVYSLVSGTWTVIDKIPFTPVVGVNVVSINKNYISDAYFGFAKGSTPYYTSTAGPERIIRLGTDTLDIGSTTTEDGGVLGYINFTVQYVSSLLDVNAIKTTSDTNSLKIGTILGLDVPAGGTTTTTTLNNTLNFVSTEELVPANKIINTIKFPYPSTTGFSFLIVTKSGSDYTVIDKIAVSPVIGMNTVLINKSYPSAVHIGTAKPGTLYYTANAVGQGRIVTLGTGTLNIGSVLPESGGVSGKMNFTVNYFSDKATIVEQVEYLTPNPTNEIMAPTKMWLIDDQPIPIYKTSMIRNNRELVNEFLLLQSASTDSDFNLPLYESFVNDKVLDSAKLINPIIQIFSKNYANIARDARVAVSVYRSVATAKTGQTRKINAIGDSLTNRGVLDFTIRYLAYISSGFTLTPLGTMINTTRNGEGREGWMYKNFIGASNRQLFTNTAITRLPDGETSSTLYQNPFLRLAISADYTAHPTWCFRNTGIDSELSYQDDPDKTGNFYIFDYGYYITQHLSGNTPDIITIALCTNDITKFGATGVTNSLFALQVMLTSIKAAAPSAKIAIIPGTIQGDNSTTWSYVCDFINQSRLLIDTLAFTNVDFLGIWVHQNRHYIFPYSGPNNGLPLFTDGNPTAQLTKNEFIHFNRNGYLPYAKALAGYLIYNA